MIGFKKDIYINIKKKSFSINKEDKINTYINNYKKVIKYINYIWDKYVKFYKILKKISKS